MKLITIFFLWCFSFLPLAVCAENIQPAQQGAQPVRERLSAVEAETKSVERWLTISKVLPLDKQKLETKLFALKAEKLELETELKEVERLSTSPIITYLAPEGRASGSKP